MRSLLGYASLHRFTDCHGKQGEVIAAVALVNDGKEKVY